MNGFSVLIVDDCSQAREGLKALLATALWCVLFTTVAIWRMSREEF